MQTSWNEFKSETVGERAIGGARYGKMLKTAEIPASATVANAVELNRSLGVGAQSADEGLSSVFRARSEKSVTRGSQSVQQSKFVSGKNFFQQGNQWFDSQIQSHPEYKRVRVEFGSADYYSLGRNDPGLLPWLSLGSNVQFIRGTTIYEVYEK
jgi:hypothetical protein